MFNDGGAHFAPKAGNTVTRMYDWVPGVTVTEGTAFTTKTPPSANISIKVGGAKPLTIHKSIAPLAQAPALPVPAPPARPVPKPICPESLLDGERGADACDLGQRPAPPSDDDLHPVAPRLQPRERELDRARPPVRERARRR